MKTYKAVIIGLTAIGAQRPGLLDSTALYGNLPQSHASAYYHHPQIELVGVCDIRQAMLDRFCENWQEIWPQMHYYTDYCTMLAAERPDFVSVVTPDHLHAEITVDAAQSGAKAIFCEKPIATTLADADRMIAACEANQVLLSIDHTRRWSPIFHKARQLVRSGELGDLRSIIVSLFSKRAMLFRNGAHMVDMLHFLAGAKVDWVWAELEDGYDHYDVYRGDGGHDPASEPAASGYLHFANGVRAVYESAKLQYPGAHFVLTCEHGRLEVTDQSLVRIEQNDQGQEVRTAVPVEQAGLTMLNAAVAELVTCLEQGGELLCSGRTARDTLAVILAMLQSHVRGNVRVDLPLEKVNTDDSGKGDFGDQNRGKRRASSSVEGRLLN